MKNILLLLITVIAFQVTAQQGLITYQHRLNRSKVLPVDRMEMNGTMPEFSQTEKQLFFTDTTSLYRPNPAKSEDEVINHARGSMTFTTPKTELRHRKTSGTTQTLMDYKGTVYLISDSVVAPEWKFSDETKTLLGYRCKKAWYTHETEMTIFKHSSRESGAKVDTIKYKQEIVAWYTEALPGSLGPDRYHSLPGLVLEVSINDGEQSLLATDIELRNVSADELTFSRAGIPVTRAAYKQILAERIAKESNR